MSLYVVATPIGNLEDITLRALSVLSSVDLVLCEDTRVTKRILDRYNITTPTLSYHARSSVSKVNSIVELLKEGKILALVSDAGTPGISDPGTKLVTEVRRQLPQTPVVTIPGASAVSAALSISGLPSSDFLFLGFLPHKKGRETLFKEIVESKRTVVFYESPHRALKTFKRLAELLSSERSVVVARELTKIHEETVSGTPAEIVKVFGSRASLKGEFVVLISPARG